MGLLHQLQIDKASVHIYETREAMGKAASEAVADAIRNVLGQQEEAGMIFAAAPSQVEMLNTLAKQPGVDWSQITAFQLDEYVRLPRAAPQSFRAFLANNIFDIVRPGRVHYIQSDTIDPLKESLRYENLLRHGQIDVACIGIGENGHIAFNDPHIADFHDPDLVKVVQLSRESRQQQVNDGCFSTLDEVPKEAITVTIPAILRSKKILCVVPSTSKSVAVRNALLGPVSAECPASILRGHPDLTMFLDLESAQLLLRG